MGRGHARANRDPVVRATNACRTAQAISAWRLHRSQPSAGKLAGRARSACRDDWLSGGRRSRHKRRARDATSAHVLGSFGDGVSTTTARLVSGRAGLQRGDRRRHYASTDRRCSRRAASSAYSPSNSSSPAPRSGISSASSVSFRLSLSSSACCCRLGSRSVAP